MIEELVVSDQLIKNSIMEKIKINFLTLRSYEELLRKENNSISLNTLQNMVDTITNDDMANVKNTIAYQTLLDLKIVEVINDGPGGSHLNS